jgi:hypothetical protein
VKERVSESITRRPYLVTRRMSGAPHAGVVMPAGCEGRDLRRQGSPIRPGIAGL